MTTDEQAIRDIVKHLEDTWNRSDSRTYAEAFAKDVTFIQIFGGQLDGRDAVEASHRVIFDTIYKNSRVAFSIRSVRFLGPDVACVFTQSRLGFTDPADKRTIDTRPTLIVARQDGQWQIAAFQNTRISEMPAAASDANRLAT
jgi:uncharacterized protein (TIGR02246 family)